MRITPWTFLLYVCAVKYVDSGYSSLKMASLSLWPAGVSYTELNDRAHIVDIVQRETESDNSEHFILVKALLCRIETWALPHNWSAILYRYWQHCGYESDRNQSDNYKNGYLDVICYKSATKSSILVASREGKSDVRGQGPADLSSAGGVSVP